MDSKTSEKNQEIIKLIDEKVEILKRISGNFSNNKISRGKNGMIFPHIGRQFKEISTLLEEEKLA